MHIEDGRNLNECTAIAGTDKRRSWRNHKALSALLSLLVLILATAGCGGGYSNPQQKPLVGIYVSSTSLPSTGVGEDLLLSATGEYRNSPAETSDRDITNSATWSTSNASVATVNKGVVSGIGAGSVTITATFGGKTGSMTVFVGDAPTIVITPTEFFTLSETRQNQFTAEATYFDGSVIDVTDYGTWRSKPSGIVQFSPYFEGYGTFVAAGTTTISATFNTGAVATATVVVVP
jgi:hypothetical protein